MVRHYSKHRTPMYVCFPYANAFVNHRKLFKVIAEFKCPALIIRLLMYWYRNYNNMYKWDNIIFNKFTVSNDIKQGGILSSVFLNINVNVLSINLNENYIGCCLKDEVANHLYYLIICFFFILVLPPASGMNEMIKKWHKNYHWIIVIRNWHWYTPIP